MNKNQTFCNKSINNNSASGEVRFENPQAQFSEEGMVSAITGNQLIDNNTTINLSTQVYRFGKFMREFSKFDFDNLQEVKQSNGSILWTVDMAIDNQDFNFYLDQAEIIRSLNLAEVQNDQQIKDMAEKYNVAEDKTYIFIDGKKYFTRMNIPMYFGTGQKREFSIDMGIYLIGGGVIEQEITGIISEVGFEAFKEAYKRIGVEVLHVFSTLVMGIIRASYRFFTKFIERAIARDGLSTIITASKNAAGEAWKGATEGIDKKVISYSLIGVIFLVSVWLIIEYVLHKSYQNINLFNLTKYDIELDFPYKACGDYQNLPTSEVFAEVERYSPNEANFDTWYYGVAFNYQSDSIVDGIGYTMRFKMKDPVTKEIVKTFSCLFEIPYEGKNSLYASPDEPKDYNAYYSTYSGQHQITQFSTNDSEQEIIVSYDYLDGKHEDPETGQDLYLYNSFIVIRDKV